jgi:hypothetical protein
MTPPSPRFAGALCVLGRNRSGGYTPWCVQRIFDRCSPPELDAPATELLLPAPDWQRFVPALVVLLSDDRLTTPPVAAQLQSDTSTAACEARLVIVQSEIMPTLSRFAIFGVSKPGGRRGGHKCV